ncbi:MAG: UvrD-helicase domain-containing protein [Treponema sp.]|nr:UvrD-helicase domain-containing protein [Treponema sp.]
MAQNFNLDYLDLLPKKLDDQQKKALSAEGNVIVAAGAGSGKTQVLATRFAYLVMSFGIKAEKILTLTFTKKAASEMYQRIYKTLDFFSQNPDVPELERDRAKEAVKNFAKVHIQTLDSYNSSILKQCASRYGIRPDFSQGEGLDKNQALRYVMKHRNEDVIRNLVTSQNSGDFQSIANDIQNEIMTRSTLASEPDNFVKLCETKKQGCCNNWREEWKKVWNGIDSYNRDFSEISDPKDTTKKSAEEMKALENLMNEISDDLSSIKNDQLDEFIKGISNISFSLPGEKVAASLKEVVRAIRFNKKEKENALTKMYLYADYMKNYQSHYEYARFLDDYMKEVNNQKRISGALSFSDISEMALKALKEQEDLRTQEQNSFDRIMIDEFQDNNQKNRDLLFLLSAKPGLSAEESLKGINLSENKLFFVGDDKQSIYKFRGADVSVFKQLGEDLGTDPVDMVYNYRSTEYLLDSFNGIFGGFDSEGNKVKNIPEAVFPEKVENNEKYAAVFAERQIAKRNMAVMPESKKEFKNSPVHFCIYNKDFGEDCEVIAPVVKKYQQELQRLGRKADFNSARDLAFMSNEDQQCYFIAKEIFDRITESGGKLSYSDFAILDKSRGMRKILVKYLSYFDIPYNLDSQIDIFESAPVNDIYNILRLCVYPSDKKALAVFLCSPFAGLSVQDVEEIYALGFELIKENIEARKKIAETLSEESLERFEKAISLFEKIRKLATGRLLAETITELWYDYGYRYETLWHKNLYLSGEQYDLLFELARQCDAQGFSLSYFIDQLDALRSAYGQDSEIDISEIEYPKEISDAVQVMTIHKSKGLQFPYVFVTGVTGNARGDYEEKDDEVSPETPFGESNSVETAKADAEFRRVIYVALTRAEKEAYVVGVSKFINGIMMSVCKAYYPAMEKNPVYSLGEYTWNEGAPFDYISICPVDRNTITEGKKKDVPLTLKAKDQFLKENNSFYDDVKIITLESQVEPDPQVTPSGLEKGQEETGEELPSENPVAPELSSLMPKLMEKNFNAAHFGTFAHAFMEAYVRDSENVLHELPAYSFRNLWDYNKSEEENFSDPICSSMISVCKKMCQAFEGSHFAGELKESQKKYPEYSFVAYQNGCVVTGIIDLCYLRPDGKVVIVDYKTDEHIHPDKYYPQLACYKDAASELFGVDKSQIECHLFYLRYGQSIDVTKEAEDSLLPELGKA